jgi:carboxylesterase
VPLVDTLAGDAAPFRFDGDRRGVLLVHGFTGTPFEMRFLGEHLAGRGYSVVGPQLAGHCGTPADLGCTGWRDWYASVERAFDELRGRVERVAVVGLSLGGLLSLELARQRGPEVVAVGALASPLWLDPWIMRGIRWLGRNRLLGTRTVPKWGGSDIADPELRGRNPATRGMPLPALLSLLEVMETVRQHLGDVAQPAFVAHGRKDHTAPFACMEVLVRCLGSAEVEQLVLERSYHCITIDVEREALFQRLTAFLGRHLGG